MPAEEGGAMLHRFSVSRLFVVYVPHFMETPRADKVRFSRHYFKRLKFRGGYFKADRPFVADKSDDLCKTRAFLMRTREDMNTASSF